MAHAMSPSGEIMTPARDGHPIMQILPALFQVLRSTGPGLLGAVHPAAAAAGDARDVADRPPQYAVLLLEG